jgi:hypothetical protein
MRLYPSITSHHITEPAGDGHFSTFSLVNYLAIKAAFKTIKPTEIMIHHGRMPGRSVSRRRLPFAHVLSLR